jgi:hypothetical protein
MKKLTKDFSILTEKDFIEYSHRELAVMQITSIDTKIKNLEKIFLVFNIILVFLPFILFFQNFEVFSMFLFVVLIFIGMKIKKRIDFKISIRYFVYGFLKDNKLID